MNYNTVVSKAMEVSKVMREQLGEKAKEGRFLVQFQNGEVYQYKSTPESMVKLKKVNFEQVVMVQFAVGASIKTGRYTKFIPAAIAMVESTPIFYTQEKEETVIADNALFNWK